MDEIDLRILEVLKENSRSSVSEISKRVRLSIPAVAERIRKMEQAGIIEQYTVKVNRDKVNYKILAFISVALDQPENIDGFRQSIVKTSAVLECHHIAGEYDYLLKVLVRDTKELENFISSTLKRIKGVVKTNTIIVLSSLKENFNP